MPHTSPICDNTTELQNHRKKRSATHVQSTTDIVIIGGGVIGCAIAYYLRKSGIAVTVIDKGEIGAEASSAAAGLLAPLGSLPGPGPLADLLLASWSIFPSLIPELEQASGMSIAYEQSGSLRVARNPNSVANLRKRMKAWQPLGLEMHWLTGDEARQREPLISPDISAAIYAPQEAQIKAPHVVKAFAQAATNLGAKLSPHTDIISMDVRDNNITKIYTAQGTAIQCNHLIIATGAWTRAIGGLLNLSLPVEPQRGQILTLKQPNLPLKHIIFGEALYLAPKNDGTIVVGATKEEVGFDKHLTAGGIAWLLATAIRLLPSLEGAVIDQMWAGLRPKTPDNLPILGKVPSLENVTLAVGHGSIGIMLSAITGQSIAELLVTGHVPELIVPFSLARFHPPQANPL
ncbi:MAG TPA: glycine oxidase ThiO [Ktedonobacteraceae bacterium]